MEEEKLVEQTPMSQEEFEDKLKSVAEANRRKMVEDFEKGTLFLRNYAAVSKYRSVRRAIKRGHVSMWGDIYPRRPYNNRKLNPQRKTLREIYGQITKRF
jgi:hypothetical protein